MAYRVTKINRSSKCSHSSTLWSFCGRFLKQNISMHSVESFSACFCEKKKLKITCPFCMAYRLTKMEDPQNALISRIYSVFKGSFSHRTFRCISQQHFEHVFAEKKVENNLLIFAWPIALPKWIDVQNARIARLYDVFAGGFLHKTFLSIS